VETETQTVHSLTMAAGTAWYPVGSSSYVCIHCLWLGSSGTRIRSGRKGVCRQPNSSCAGQLCTVEGAEAITSNPLEYKKVNFNYNWGSKAPAWPYCVQPCCLGMPSATRCTVQARTSCTARHVSVHPHKGASAPTQPTPAPAPISRSNDSQSRLLLSPPHIPPRAHHPLQHRSWHA
jgi:hypothetical protein